MSAHPFRPQRSGRSTRRRSAIASSLLLLLGLGGCDPITGDEPGSATYEGIADSTLAESLAFTARELCVPYVVDGVTEATLARRPGIAERRYYIHGKLVTAYELDQPGSPRVLLFQRPPIGCRVDLATTPSTDRRVIVEAFRSNPGLEGRVLSRPHRVEMPGVLETGERRGAVTCIHGNADAVVFISNPPPEYPIAVYVESNAGIVASNGCGSANDMSTPEERMAP